MVVGPGTVVDVVVELAGGKVVVVVETGTVLEVVVVVDGFGIDVDVVVDELLDVVVVDPLMTVSQESAISRTAARTRCFMSASGASDLSLQEDDVPALAVDHD